MPRARHAVRPLVAILLALARGKPLALRPRDAADLLGLMGWQLGVSWGGAKPAAAAAGR